jgi:hypothetical protein
MLDRETLLRTLAVGAAVAILAAPYWRVVADALQAAVAAAQAHAHTLGRIAAAGLIVAAAWGKIPLPTFEVPAVPAVTVEEPSAEMKTFVAPIAAALRSLPAGDRMLWASTWSKAAVVVAGDATAREAAFTDTRSLQAFTGLALDIAWRRIGQHEPGENEPLRKALEAAYGAAVGTDEVPVTRDIRDRYAAFAKAVAWAGVNGG